MFPHLAPLLSQFCQFPISGSISEFFLTVVPFGRLNPLPAGPPSFPPLTLVRAEVKCGMPREANDVIRSDSVTTACVSGIEERSENEGSRSDPIT